MITKKQNKKQTIFGFFLLGLLMLLFYLLVAKIWSIFSSVDPRLGAGLVAASATILVSVISVFVSKHLERRAETLTHLRDKKTPTYEKIINFIFSVTFAEKLEKEKPKEKEIIEFMAEITPELIVWGSDEMLDAFHKFKTGSIKLSEEKNQSPYAILIMVEEFLLAIRKDLGHKNKSLSRGKILGLFINDLPADLDKI